jgi:hypothetical protein
MEKIAKKKKDKKKQSAMKKWCALCISDTWFIHCMVDSDSGYHYQG